MVDNPLDLVNAVSEDTGIETTAYTYDANGNQITKITDDKTETYTYDGLNQLIGFTDGEIVASYAYNVDGLRIKKTVDDKTIHHVWDGSQQIIADVVDNEFYEANCYLRGTNLVATYNYQNGVKSGYTYYTQNAHGDVVNLTDETGAVTKSYTYDAFGVEQNIDDADDNAFRYCGEYYDSESGTIYLRARYYDPTIGRFISRDSVAGKNTDPLSLNLYTYCHNNPIIGTDPSGHWLHIAVGALIGGASELVGQLIDNGGHFSEVNWAAVGMQTFSGGLSAALGPFAGTATSALGDVLTEVIKGERDGSKLFGTAVESVGSSIIGSGISSITGKIVGKKSVKALYKKGNGQIKNTVVNMIDIKNKYSNKVKNLDWMKNAGNVNWIKRSTNTSKISPYQALRKSYENKYAWVGEAISGSITSTVSLSKSAYSKHKRH